MGLPFPEIDPVAFSIGPIAVRWYALAYLTGFIGGWKYALHLCGMNPNHRPTREDIDNFLPYAVLGVILGGRIGYVLFYQLSLYIASPLDAFKVWEGGMSFHGGALGVILALVIFSWVNKIQLLRLSDIVCACVPIGLFFGRLANFVNGELYGRPTDVPWGMVFPWGGEHPRHPSQIYEAFLEGAVLFSILLFLYKKTQARHYPGVVTGAFLAGYASFRMLVEQFRQPDSHLGFIIGEISMGQILSLPMLLVGVGIMAYALKDHFIRKI
ncbi:MAG TPA: prolipoprotein diacylglyceryl transferase [Alphaproteobacteria bacterium]|nr:prolipoprotein diacylglyceryl transferase [Alphaproteobacteria bacterium]